MFYIFIFFFFLSFEHKLFSMENFFIEKRSPISEVDYFSNQPKDIIVLCVLPDAFQYMKILDNNIVVTDDPVGILNVLMEYQKVQKDVVPVALTNKRLYEVLKPLINLPRDFWNIQFDIDAFCKNPKNKDYIDQWKHCFFTGILCLEQDYDPLIVNTEDAPEDTPLMVKIEQESAIQKHYYQNNALSFIYDADFLLGLRITLSRKYHNPDAFGKNVFFQSLKKISREGLLFDNLIALITNLNNCCHICNSEDKIKIFPNTQHISKDNKGISCSCLCLIKSLLTIRSLFDQDQFLRLSTTLPQKVVRFNIEYTIKQVIVDIPLPVDCKPVPLTFLKEVGFLL